ncbi:Enoyl-CoA hydratase [Desulfurella amilsii]|uniref:Enoyl-CoA hydratase n=1 Tax=Desulfurella amilsii TaxID=1562698 RepID=A0A1X4XUP5_9BACT|nr:enoyl-CoA hydratase/isomerase family protein [Desulfurella amilsii]OSS41252.1 Enoyl-CoA hydratase [Desulfurella amilsii]
MPAFKNIIYTEEDNITWIQFNRPNKLNAFTREMWEELYQSLELAKGNKTTLVVVTGTGKAFSAGDDIPSMYKFKTKEESLNFFSILEKPFESLLDFEKPLIGMVNGLAYGGGCELLFFMDIIVAGKDSKFALPETKLGLIPPGALSVGYNVLGIKQINRLALTGEAIDVYEAQRIGLVDYIVEPDKLKDKTLEITRKILSNSKQPMQFIKRLSNKRRIKVELANMIEKLAAFSIEEESKQRMGAFINKKNETSDIFC